MSTGREIILQRYQGGGKAIRMKRTSKKPAVAHYVRVSVKDPDNEAAKQKVDLSQFSDEELGAGIYIPTHERVFRNRRMMILRRQNLYCETGFVRRQK